MRDRLTIHRTVCPNTPSSKWRRGQGTQCSLSQHPNADLAESSAERIFVSTYSCSLLGGLSLTEGTLPWGCSCSTSGCRRCCSSEGGEWNELLAGRLPSLAALYTLSCGLLLEHSTSQLVWFGLANEMEGFGHLTRCTNEVPPQALACTLPFPFPFPLFIFSSPIGCW